VRVRGSVKGSVRGSITVETLGFPVSLEGSGAAPIRQELARYMLAQTGALKQHCSLVAKATRFAVPRLYDLPE